MTQEEKYMRRCLYLAKLGIYSVSPNPMVGAVIVHADKIIGEGYHRRYGDAHAEPNAIHSVVNQGLLPESTLYVNLEPCSYFGKTPPCANLIVSKKIRRVVIGCLDPNPKVSGRGVDLLRNAGVDVVVGVLESESRDLNKRFIIQQEEKRPFILLKWAQTSDGFIDNVRTDNSEKALKISNSVTGQLTHKMRAENMGIMVGKNTVLLDNPSLTVRNWYGKNPIRITIDKKNEIPENFNLKNKEVCTLIFNNTINETQEYLEYVKIDDLDENLPVILTELYKKNIHSVLVEGGAQLLNSFIRLNLWDEANIEISTQTLTNGVKAPVIQEEFCTSKQVIEGHKWKHYVR
ncbi:MAG: bifunctional diaminohydroxyphosphoribosylaminopyrimidine deaminase/5-amino-6-(5-phosphoribosylamino)uracil reductase RibD [Porphyromonadaceae bacterium]|nr:bifunctional diaminohydroxyphosphoribosylaminopyrimidine deaminase/5-amino-6-(5-phosphoribosylamino)uracil reductase RibD [Porphyromonadaceae bacterium]